VRRKESPLSVRRAGFVVTSGSVPAFVGEEYAFRKLERSSYAAKLLRIGVVPFFDIRDLLQRQPTRQGKLLETIAGSFSNSSDGVVNLGGMFWRQLGTAIGNEGHWQLRIYESSIKWDVA
jgi:hypothetical protein